ncbi:MAG: hypothetical protein QOH40_1729 [Arthrobacter pascens]|uniref:hypothetical protein n=1 Tax=Arthrobacter pascens TaxID=1677 RepID=UPI00196AB5C2|nr:hypothetical protein [Arthrobacter pascens]MBN3499250.1 hypothetical protein [Arthrobacter pascens]MDQ1595173.1 hypothetical protein [Arthrobacter pascens]MDR6557193.1 putative membrane protein [Arthrobacter pascens]
MTRVRVTAPRSAARPAVESREAAEESAVGQVFVRSLIRSQLRLALVVAGGFLLVLGAFPLLAAIPGLAESRIAGIPLDWLLLGTGIYPVTGISAWLYIRSAARNEARYRDLAEDR